MLQNIQNCSIIKSCQIRHCLAETCDYGVFCMYYRHDFNQLSIDDFFLPFGGKLRKDNRWVRMAAMMPWEYIDEIYAKNMSIETGRRSIPSRIAFGAIFIKEFCNLTDEGTVAEIQENAYMQYFLGLHEFQDEPLFDPSMMVHFRKRFPVNEVAQINEYFCTGKRPDGMRDVDRNKTAEQDEDEGENKSQDDDNLPPAPTNEDDSQSSEKKKGKHKSSTSKKKEKRRKKNRGKLIMDATVAPADITYPTDIGLLNKSREHLENAINVLWKEVPHTGHKLPYSAKAARKSYLNLAKCKKWTRAKCRKAIGEQFRYIELATSRLDALKKQVPNWEALLPAWLRSRLDVIPKVYAQQKQMYDNNVNVCENRVVSLEQPHVRPIKRGKRPNPTEFGQKLHLSTVDGYTYLEQTSWSNFNETLDLQGAVENYFRREGVYPSAVLADQIYQTRANKMYCKEKGIRLSGLPLGRRNKTDTDAKLKRQMYKDSCQRNAIEGRNGTAKRRFELGLIMSKLDESAKTEAALNILAMNASHRLVQWLAHFFSFRWFLVGFAVFQ